MHTAAMLTVLASLAILGSAEEESSPKVAEAQVRTGVWDACNNIREEAQTIRNEGYSAVSRADEIRENAYRTKEEAFQVKEEALEVKESVLAGRLTMETTLVETLALIRSQATATSLHIQDMKESLKSIVVRVNRLEEKAQERSAMLDTKIEELHEGVAESIAQVKLIQSRQRVWMSEIRLISHFKLTEGNNRHPSGFDSDIIVDGQFLFATTTHANMRPYSHTADASAGNKLVVKLGGQFRIHKIKLWNTRDSCCMAKLVGLHVYAGTRLVGTVIRTQFTYDYEMLEEDPIYAETVTLLQPLAQHLHILEIQVWGNGPFPQDDLFL
ncbi:hypothetical protein ACHWQZ_G018515 [Mnemiopsis leidyi]